MNGVWQSITEFMAQPWSWAGAFAGLIMLAGFSLVFAGLPIRRRPGLIERVEPYIRDAPRPSKLLAASRPIAGPFGLGTLIEPYLKGAASRVERLFGGADSVASRQLRAGVPADVERFRAKQVVWGVLGALLGLGLSAVISLSRGEFVVPAIVGMFLVGALGGMAMADWWLTRQAVKREHRMLEEFPTIAELLALAVSAGEGAVGALERVVRISKGELSDELRRCLADARAGANLQTALQGLAERTGLPSLSRFVDGIVIAVERGTPLADVLRAQAQDVREDGRRQLMESGGKKEITMMIPVVFLILPVTILFAVYPGIGLLNFSI